MAKGWRKSQRKKAAWWPAVVAYLRDEAIEPVTIKTIIGNAKTQRHYKMNASTGGKRSRDYLLCKSGICPTPNQVSQYLRVKKVPFVEQTKGGRLYYWSDDVEE